MAPPPMGVRKPTAVLGHRAGSRTTRDVGPWRWPAEVAPVSRGSPSFAWGAAGSRARANLPTISCLNSRRGRTDFLTRVADPHQIDHSLRYISARAEQ